MASNMVLFPIKLLSCFHYSHIPHLFSCIILFCINPRILMYDFYPWFLLRFTTISSMLSWLESSLPLKNVVWLSCDHCWFSLLSCFVSLVASCMQPLTGFGVSKVLISNHPNFKPGDIVTGITSWENYSVINGGSEVRKIADTDLPLSYHVGVLGKSPDKFYGKQGNICAAQCDVMPLICKQQANDEFMSAGHCARILI